MSLSDPPWAAMRRFRPPRTTVRWRLTLLYGSLFLGCGAALLAITYALVAHASITHTGPSVVALPRRIQVLLPPRQVEGTLRQVQSTQRIADLHWLIIESAIALAVMAIASAALGWLVAGRVLAPLRTITASTRQISETNLHQRLAIAGPRDELSQLASTIDGLLERLEAAFDAQRRFVANASHELRTPLTTMRATLDVAIAKPHVPPQLQALDANLREDLDQADRLLESFLTLARAQHRELGEPAAVSLTQLVAEALAVCSGAIAAKQLDLSTTLTPVWVAGSETLLGRMIENVVENAVRHNQADGFVRVALELDGTHARLGVESGGPIIDQHAVTQLAQPFRRLGAERTGSENGHGLGLSIVGAIATAHGGNLELTARHEGGLRVQITLPDATDAQTLIASA